MDNTNKEKFESLWDDFIANVRGRLISTAEKQTISLPLANLILSDAASSWMSEYEIYGRWLMKYQTEDPSKAELVRDVLTKDMTFREVNVKSELPDYCNYVIPAVGAVVGYATGYLFGFGKIGQLISAAVPAVLLYPAVKFIRDNQVRENIDTNVNLYMDQLNKYRDSVISILS